MKKLITVVILSMLLFSVTPFFAYSQQQAQTYISPNLQGTPITELNPNIPIYINIFALPNNMNELLFLMQQEEYGQVHLTRSQIIKEFAPVSQIKNIESYLEANGFSIVFKTPFSLTAEAPVSLVDKIFNTTLYLYNINGEIAYKPEYKPLIPSQLHNVIITGLTNYTQVSPKAEPQDIILGMLKGNTIVQVNASNALPLSSLQFAYTYYTPGDLEGAYNVTGPEGKNVTVAIIDAYGDPEIQQDINTFDAKFDLPKANLTIVPIGPYHPIFGLFTGWDIETALDVEAVHTMAPYANIQLVVPYSASFSAILQAIIYIVAGDTAQVVDMSFGAPENEFTTSGLYGYYFGAPFVNYPLVDYYFALGAAEGITFVAASGDEGAYAGTYTTYGGVSFPSSSPFVLSVGGTTLYVNVTSGYISASNSSATYGYETAWSVLPQYESVGTSTVSSDGGYSTFFPAPYWQRYITNSDFRTTPDVSADANPYTGFLTIVDGAEEIIGGTSLSAQLWGGVIADIYSYIGQPLGLIAPILYSIYQNSTLYNMAFHQVTLGYNGKYYAHSGYNLVTGLGSPNVGMLEYVIKDYLNTHKSLDISLITYEPGVTYPWYMYNTTFTIVADISYPNGTPVVSGSFSAYIYTLSGYLASIPLTYNGTYWIGNYTIMPGDTPNVWTIVVNGTSNGYEGEAETDIDVGESIDILQPINSYLTINSEFSIVACIYYPNGTPVITQSFSVYFVHDGKTVFTSKLLPGSIPGCYQGTGGLIYPQPQGTYLMFINNTYSSAYGWDYIGLIDYGIILSPINDGFTSVSPGENMTVLGFIYDIDGLGLFTSTAYAELLTTNGTLIEKVPMTLAPDVTQFGIYNLFGYHEANITIPQNISPGFYKVVIAGELNTSTGPMYGNFTTFIYVSQSTLNYQVKSISTVVQGEYVKVLANITYQNGTEVKYGEFTAGFIPAELNFESIVIESDTGVPLQYNSTLGEWVGIYQIPSILTEQNTIYEGASLEQLVGPWDVVIVGTSSNGENLISSPNYFTVMPYTYLGNIIISNNNITSIPLVSFNGTAYIIQGVYVNSLKISSSNIPIIIENSEIKTVYVDNSRITIDNSKINNISVVNSDVLLVQDVIGNTETAIAVDNSNISVIATLIYNSQYAFNQTNSIINLEGVSYQNVMTKSVLPAPTIVSYSPSNITTSTATVSISISGEDLKVTNVTIDGVPVTFTVSSTSSGIDVSIPFNAYAMAAGPYVIDINLTDGLQYTLHTTIYNSYPQVQLSNSISSVNSSLSSKISSASSSLSSSISSVNSSLSSKISSASSTATDGVILGIVGIILAIIAIIFVFRRGGKK
ncbi:peptidase S53 [Acidianus sulfidivorans JP7]|uniref:Peptidase S53 n=1 Tax=Acidianus sulfidivorans JP7 TaxID=619593 RepID=A0A2U9IK35_9CREN|nr:protease pro-enzyme activation domain-containing protein [Acidianus sulfidivorans]AWR96388.1 peptidase S53 [Acidianus sulfidivorans JP7]